MTLAGSSDAVRHLSRLRWRRRARFVDAYAFPHAFLGRAFTDGPELSPSEAERVLEGLRDWFRLCQGAGPRRFLVMPSRAVDELWHEFILFILDYSDFCRGAFGRYLHHTPAEALDDPLVLRSGLVRSWDIACDLEGIDPDAPARLPAIFALDETLGIPDGVCYELVTPGPGATTAGESEPGFRVRGHGPTAGGRLATGGGGHGGNGGCGAGCGGGGGGCGGGSGGGGG